MKKWLAFTGVMLVLMTACTPVYERTDEVVRETTDETNQDTAIIPSFSGSGTDYRVILTEDAPKTSASRGVTTNQMNNRMDIAEFENGLKRHSKEYFPADEYFFQQGQFLTSGVLYEWLSRSSESNEEGLNPELDEEAATEEDFRNAPRYISNIVEQDYLVRNGEDVVETRGITIGIALRSEYNFTVDNREMTENHTTKELLQKGKQYAETILNRLREMEEVPDVPIMFALYEEERNESQVPGNFIAKSYAEGNTLGNFERVKEDYVLFPSEEATENHFDDAQVFSEFRTKISDYFPDFVGVIGQGFYVNDELRNIKMEIPVEFNSQAEIDGFTQYVHSLVREMFSDHYGVEVRIHSLNRQESLIVRERGEEEPYVYVYD
ncbi:CamS family sex pheromone protein [Salimicrobium halophilum]|uniref:Protein involved in sex pheromone biosynthesis n=1 Tax=Salimicrobium halophilum TaxID=86666 RepID=A0A1G8UDN3_9BACI|nr:CamS family sex pheromone protein [Salimicrobium halophilum]SDJ51946.1 Protein involved in sex pheromone biosynthesis [Salimicrobium halophilum]